MQTPDAPIVRPMTIQDLDAVLEIEHLCFSTPWSRASFVREITQNRCARYLVLEAAGEVAAYAGMWLVIDEGHITNIAVHPAYRGIGYGEGITRALMQAAADMGMGLLTLEVRRSNAVAQSLYRKLGFVNAGLRKRYYEDNKEDALLMLCETLPGPRSGPFAREGGEPDGG